MRQKIRLLQGAVVALCLVTIGVVLSCGGSTVAIAVQPPGIPTVYGDGSAGALDLSSSTAITAGNTQFTSIDITGAGTVINVPSGTVLHCTGTFTIGAGATLRVSTGAFGGFMTASAAGTISPEVRQAGQGVAIRPAGFPEVGGTGEFANGAGAGAGLGSNSKFLRYPGHLAGGAGGGASGALGGAGGGGLTVLAFGAIQIAGTLQADGTDSSEAGGGAGGVVVLASASGIATTGTVAASGGAGGASTATHGAGGGGGGGIINLLAPSITGVDGVNYVVDGGAAGSDAVNATAAFRSGGGGGGGCGGNGGTGGSVDAADVTAAATASIVGAISHIATADPVGLFP